MRGKRPTAPASGLISLGSKPKKPLLSTSTTGQGCAGKKAKGDFIEVEPSELVSRTETALNNGNLNLAESLVLSALNQLRASGGPTSSAVLAINTPGFRSVAGPSGGSRLIPGFSLGLLILAQAHPTLFTRVAVLDQLIALLSLSPRELGIALPPAAVATMCARARGLHVLVANLIYFAFASSPKWPSRLVKVYLEDSLMDRIWVDQDECRAFVLNLETAFPKVYGDPRGLFTVLSSSSGSSTSQTPSSSSNPGSSSSSSVGGNSTAVHAALGLIPGPSSANSEMYADNTGKDAIAEAVATTLKLSNTSMAKVIHGVDPLQQVSPRFESSRQAVEVMIVNTLREALGRRGAGVGSTTAGGAVACGSNSSSSGAQSTTASVTGGLLSGSGSSQGISPSVGSTEITQLRGLIRTVSMACGLPEVRGLVATRLEPWITNPKLQIYTVGLLAIIASNCRLGGQSSYDLDVMISFIFRIRYKLLKPNIQAAFLECLSHMVKANPMNLYCLIHLCAMPESRPPLNGDASSDGKTAYGQLLGQTVLKIAETVRSMSHDASEDRTGKAAQQQQVQLNAANMTAVAAGASSVVATRGAASIYTILPFLCQRFGAQWIRIMGNLLHERLLLAVNSSNFGALSSTSTLTANQVVDEVTSAMGPMHIFLRELARNSRPNLTDSGPLCANQGSGTLTPSNQTQLMQQVYLPCAELAGALLQDRNYRVNTTAAAAANAIINALSANEHRTSADQSPIVGVGRVQFYLNALMSLVCALQMLSAGRPHLIGTSASRRTAAHLDAMKAHQTALRQIRLAVVRWAKTILPTLVNTAVQSTSASHVSPSTHLLSCMDALKPSLLIRRAFMLESSAPLQRINSITYELTPFYPVKEIWANDQEHSMLIRLVTDTVLPEKLAHQLLILGLEPTRQLFNPLDSLDMVCGLIGRAALLARDSGLEPLNVTKPQQLIDLLFASCTYVGEQQLPSDVTELAYASAYWRVCTTAVILAAHCLQTCGLHLWTHYPTVRRLMEMVMTDDFTGDSFSAQDVSTEEAERLNSQLEVQLILRLESFLLNPNPECTDTPMALVTPETSKLLGRLVHNNPRGPCRLPPAEHLNNLQTLAQDLRLGRRLWRCRDPDFLLELLRSQAAHTVVQPWLVRLVESSGSDFELLPIQCLCEYLLRDTLTKMRQSRVHILPLTTMKQAPSDPMSLTNSVASENSATAPTSVKEYKADSGTKKSQLRVYLVAKLRESLRTFGNSTTADALVHSFFARLNHRNNWIRQAVRQCLYILTETDITPGNRSPDSVFDWLNVLHTLLQLPVLRFKPGDDTSTDVSAEPAQHLLSALLESLLVETDLNILTGNLVFLSHITRSSNFVSWRPVITILIRFIQTRPNILSALLHRPSASSTGCARTESTLNMSYLALEALSEMHVRYVEYNCTVAGAIPVDELKSVFVTWSSDRECPLELELIEAQLLLLTYTHSKLPHQTPSAVAEFLNTFVSTDFSSSSEHSWWLRLLDTWFVPVVESNEEGQFRLPKLTPFATHPVDFPSAAVVRQTHLSFDLSTDENQSPRPCLSSALRCGLIRSNHFPLVSGALWRINATELISVLKNLPIYLLNEDTARRLLDCWNSLEGEISVEAKKQLDRKILRLREKCSTDVPMSVDLPEVHSKIISETQPIAMDTTSKEEATASVDQVQQQLENMVWSDLVNALLPLTNSDKALVVCKIAQQLASDQAKRDMWISNLNMEVTSMLRDSVGTRSPKTGRSRSRTSHSLSLSPFMRVAGSDALSCRTIRPLVSICLQYSPETMCKLHAALQDAPEWCSEAQYIREHLFTSLLTASETSKATEESAQATVTHLEKKAQTLTSKVEFVDNIGQFGLLELTRIMDPVQSTDVSDVHEMDPETVRLLSAVEYTVFRQTKLSPSTVQPKPANAEPDEAYLLRCLLQQANPSILWHLLRSLLRNANVECIESSQLLDFYLAVLTLPRLAYPVPRSEPRDRPDPSAALSELHRLSLLEAINLTRHILYEAKQTASQSPDRVVHVIDATLLRRIACLNVAITQHPAPCILYLELFSGCISPECLKDSDACLISALPEHVTFRSPSDVLWNLTALRLLTLLYQRWPGTLGLVRSPLTKAWMAHPWRIRKLVHDHLWLKTVADMCDHPLGNVDLVPQPEIDRLGPLLLVSLTSSSAVLAESAQLASKALFVQHSRAVLRLLPILAALSDGRLGLSWTQFSSRRYHLLFGDLLHLLELLTTFNTDDESETDDGDPNVSTNSQSALFSEEAILHRGAIERLLGNMIRMLARFHHQARKLGGFPIRLCRLLESYASIDAGRQSLNNLFKTVSKELDLLMAEFDEFTSLLAAVGVNTEKTDSDTSQSSPVFPVLSSTTHVGRVTRRWNVAVQPFRQRLHCANNTQTTIELLEDLDETSKRKVDVLLHFKSDLVRLISHPNESVCSLALRLLLRFMVQFPRWAPNIIETGLLPCLSPKLLDQSGLRVPLLEALPSLCLLSPMLAPKLLHSCVQTILFGAPNSSSYETLTAVEESVRRLTLDGLDAACVEHAASALVSRTNLIRGGPSS